ncbi:ABC transporter permease [Chitinophagaceae bacterium LB-8]|uniref:ABC transporter permease n=1 Tax=Paraflavisolibacter caeni TaxID=2982496 RepID=A0A9X3BH89_9BACT|nr:ABC transporter permease [Paraflavisolibacter caeni]MCU7548573.1 ABC transporter permease [Paraflavisolibacter caeni]
MLQNFFKVAIRNLIRHKGFSFINIAGLTFGLTACMLITLFVWDEKQYDRFLPNGERVYRIYNESTNNEGVRMLAPVPPMFATTLQQDFPAVEKTARIMMQPEYSRLFEAGKVKLYEASGFYVDSTYFDIFQLPFKYGSRKDALDDPASIVISEEMSRRFFGNDNPVGKSLLMEKQPFFVKGVFYKHPKFHLQFNYLVPMAAAGIPADRIQSWRWQQFYSYVKVKKGADVQKLEAEFKKTVAQKTETFRKEDRMTFNPFFQRLEDIHLYSADFKYDMSVRGNITYVKALTIIAVFILLIACFNFINLATAKSLQRAKEVGVRKSIGANRKQLMIQFTGETILLAFISILFSVVLTFLFLPLLNQFTDKQISFPLFTNPIVLLLLFLLTVLVGVLAGFYPALVLSGFHPVKVLKGNVVSDVLPGRIPWLRHGLVVIQFTLSVLLIISALVVYRQVKYLHNKDLGFSKEQIMFFPMRGDQLFRNHESFKNELLQSPGISSVSIGYGFPGDAVAGDQIIVPRNGEQKIYSATHLIVDHDYIKTLGLQLVVGRDFSKQIKTDKDEAFIINETAVKELGFGTPGRALGQTLLWPTWNDQRPDSLKKGMIIGVVKDFHYKSLYDKLETAVLHIYPDAYWKVAVKMKAAAIDQSIQHVKQVWNRYTPDYPIEYNFLDESFGKMYKAEDKLKALVWVFTAIAISVGCLGLFGLAAFAAERRKKEVGIRKVLGASVRGVVLLLSKDFVKLVLISLLIASPVAWYFMNQWLQDFAYRIDLGLWVFVVAGVSALMIALITVSFQAIKAAIANPVKSLRTE